MYATQVYDLRIPTELMPLVTATHLQHAIRSKGPGGKAGGPKPFRRRGATDSGQSVVEAGARNTLPAAAQAAPGRVMDRGSDKARDWKEDATGAGRRPELGGPGCRSGAEAQVGVAGGPHAADGSDDGSSAGPAHAADGSGVAAGHHGGHDSLAGPGQRLDMAQAVAQAGRSGQSGPGLAQAGAPAQREQQQQQAVTQEADRDGGWDRGGGAWVARRGDGQDAADGGPGRGCGADEEAKAGRSGAEGADDEARRDGAGAAGGASIAVGGSDRSGGDGVWQAGRDERMGAGVARGREDQQVQGRGEDQGMGAGGGGRGMPGGPADPGRGRAGESSGGVGSEGETGRGGKGTGDFCLETVPKRRSTILQALRERHCACCAPPCFARVDAAALPCMRLL
jgi:hypothetical protein